MSQKYIEDNRDKFLDELGELCRIPSRSGNPVAPWSGPLNDVCGVLNIPSVAFGVGHADSHDHAPNENIRISDYGEGIRCMAAFMCIYARA